MYPIYMYIDDLRGKGHKLLGLYTCSIYTNSCTQVQCNGNALAGAYYYIGLLLFGHMKHSILYSEQNHSCVYLIWSKAVVYFKQVNVTGRHVGVTVTLLRCSLAHGVATQSEEGLTK